MAEQRIAAITGVTGGLGRVLARSFLDAGFAVAGIARADGLNLAGVHMERADVTVEADVRRAIGGILGALGKIDVLVNAAGGFGGGKPVWDTDEQTWDHMLGLNLKATFLCCKAVVPAMTAAGFGRIVNISSRTAVQPGAHYAAYGVSKMGVITLTETLAAELKGTNVTANVLLPSVIDTAANRDAMPKAKHSTWVRPESIAAVTLDVVSDRWGIVSGAAIPVYGAA